MKKIIKIILNLISLILMFASGIMDDFHPDVNIINFLLGMSLLIVANLKEIKKEIKEGF